MLASRDLTGHPLEEPVTYSTAQLDFMPKQLEVDKKLWRAVQSTIMSVTNSYSSTYSLNKVVSDLMALTKSICEDGPCVLLQRAATMVLIQLLAPIAPATAEECWSRLHPLSSSAPESWRASIFDHPFPETDGTFELLAPETQTCAVQVNGKLKFTVEMPVPDERLEGRELQTWMVGQIMGTDEGKRRLVGPMDVGKAKKVIVVRGGKTVNFVL